MRPCASLISLNFRVVMMPERLLFVRERRLGAVTRFRSRRGR